MLEHTSEIFSFTPTKSVQGINITQSGIVVIRYQDSVARGEKNLLVYLPTNEPEADYPRPIDLSSREGSSWSGHWTCRSLATDLDQDLLPPECRSASR